jgi:hypothetical protein
MITEWLKGIAQNSSAPLGIQFLVDHGHHHELMQHPLTASKPMGQCYANALNMALDDKDLVYCEGWGTSSKIAYVPLDHAWVFSPRRGRAIDCTWEFVDTELFGVALNKYAVLDLCSETGMYGVLPNLYRLRHQNVLARLEALIWRPEP